MDQTPTKENNGDEYYWQHQDQLQQSMLHFDSQPVEHQLKKPANMPVKAIPL